MGFCLVLLVKEIKKAFKAWGLVVRVCLSLSRLKNSFCEEYGWGNEHARPCWLDSRSSYGFRHGLLLAVCFQARWMLISGLVCGPRTPNKKGGLLNSEP